MNKEEIIADIARLVDEADEKGLCPGFIYPTRYGYMMHYEGKHYCTERMSMSSTDALIEHFAEKVLAKDVFVEPEEDEDE